MAKTLDDIKFGDKVVVTTRFSKSVQKVTCVTKCYIIAGGEKYKKSDGEIVNANRWNQAYISVVSPDEIEDINKKQLHDSLVLKVQSIPFYTLTTEQLQTILDTVYKC